METKKKINNSTNSRYTINYHPHTNNFATAGWDGKIKILQVISSP
ncbi:hypothetical protein RintRC_0788 [Richelia intracellularis]|nr:hypothetical protein RintRC_0788 [Richelia intracellularis]